MSTVGLFGSAVLGFSLTTTSTDFVPPVASLGGTRRQLQLQQTASEIFLGEHDYRLGGGRQTAPSLTLLCSVCANNTLVTALWTRYGHPSPARHTQTPLEAAPAAPSATHQPRDKHLGSCSSFIAQEVGWLRQDGAVQNDRSPVSSGSVPALQPPSVDSSVHQRSCGSGSPCTLGRWGGRSSRGGIQVRGRGLILPLPAALVAPATSLASDGGNTGRSG